MPNIMSVAAGAAIVGYLYLIAPNPRDDADKRPFRVSYAHRGLHGNGVPENSLSAFRRAVDAGVGIELDLHLSSDGEVMVFHDDTLDRMTGYSGNLSEMSAATLRTLRLNDTEEKIPYFHEVLALVNGKVPLLIELKGRSTTDMRLCEKVSAMLKNYKGLYCIESFNPMQLRWWKLHRPDVIRGQLVTNLVKKKKGISKDPVDYLLTPMLTNVLSRPDFVAADKRMKNLSVYLTTKVMKADLFEWTVKGDVDRRVALQKGKYPIFELIYCTAEENDT